MIRRAAWPWAVAGILLFVDPISAQVSRRLQGCRPYSQPANGLSDERARSEAPRPPRIVVDDVRFDGPALPDEINEQLAQVIKNVRTRARPGWIDEVAEILVRGTLQDEGYFRVEPKADAQVLSGDAAFQHVTITLQIDLGLQYRLGEVSFRSAYLNEALAFPLEELRATIPLSEGDLFSAEKIRESDSNLRKLYGSKGYIDFVAEPIVNVDDATQRISLIMQLDQQKQFRIGKVKVISLDPTLQPLFESIFRPGNIFNSQALEDFFQENKSAFPPNASLEDMEVEHRDVKAGIVDLRFNLLTCSQFRIDPRPVK